MAVYITGDCHGRFEHVADFCHRMKTTTDDFLVILGDAGINYWGPRSDSRLKKQLAKLPITLFCIHGNHEMRPSIFDKDGFVLTHDECAYGYAVKLLPLTSSISGLVMYEEKFPNLLFAIDGSAYQIDTQLGIKSALVCGGAYSVDKFHRLKAGYGWWSNEQPNKSTKQRVEEMVQSRAFELMLTHTCPARYVPTEMFLPGIDQSRVDRSTEDWLDTIWDKMPYLERWYCGHWHTSKKVDKMQFMYNDFDIL